MAGQPIVTAKPISKGNWLFFLQGVLSAYCTKVKLPKVTHGRVEHHPGGAPSKVTAPSGRVEYDDLTVTICLGEVPGDPLYLWFKSIVEPLTGFGVPANAADRPFSLVQMNNSFVPVKTCSGLVWPVDRDWEELEGGSDDPSMVTMTFAVSWYDEIP